MSDLPRRPMKPATALVHGGSLRSSFGELSEALFLTQSFAYPSAEAAEARFKGEDPGFVYSRFSNPTVAMFEKRMCLLEGAEAARATASGMAAVSTLYFCLLSTGDHVVCSSAVYGPSRPSRSSKTYTGSSWTAFLAARTVRSRPSPGCRG